MCLAFTPELIQLRFSELGLFSTPRLDKHNASFPHVVNL